MATEIERASQSEVDRKERLAELIAENGEAYLEQYLPGSMGCHELLDRAASIASLAERMLLDHPACIQNPEWYALAEQATSLLNDLYQNVGRDHLAPSGDTRNPNFPGPRAILRRALNSVFSPEAVGMTPEQVAETLSRRSGIEVSEALLVSLASAFAMDRDRVCWRAFKDLVAGDTPEMPTEEMANRLNAWGDAGDCWRPVAFELTGTDVQALADALKSERDCWKVFREMVDATIPDWREMERGWAEEN